MGLPAHLEHEVYKQNASLGGAARPQNQVLAKANVQERAPRLRTLAARGGSRHMGRRLAFRSAISVPASGPEEQLIG